VLAVFQQVFGPEHPNTLTTVKNLAIALGAQGKSAEAKRMLREVLVAQHRVLGPKHPDTLATIERLAACVRLRYAHGI
jgi:hypothetical protein